MQRRAIRRMVSLALGLALLGGLAFGTRAALASGGGGCGRRVTDARGAAISIRSFCFTPTILRVRTGQSVTWTNRDAFAHTVMGANATWGSFEVLRGKHSVTYRFVRPGVYPYVCTFHPGMVGAVIVGSANGRGAAGPYATAAGPVTSVSGAGAPAPEATALAASQDVAPGVDAGGWPLAAVIGFGLAGLVSAAWVFDRRRRHSAVGSE